MIGKSGECARSMRPVRLEFPILSLNPSLAQRCVAPDMPGLNALRCLVDLPEPASIPNVITMPGLGAR